MAATETREKELSFLHIDAAHKEPLGPERRRGWLRWAVVGAVVVLLIVAGAVLSSVFANAPEVTVARPGIERAGGTAPVVLTAGGYIVAHHTIEVSSKVVGRVAWIGVEKGDRVKAGQALVRLEDQEYRAQLEQARANLAATRARVQELETGSRPQEIDAARAQVEQARADMQNDAVNLRRALELHQQGVASKQQLDDAQARADVSKARLETAQKNYELVKIGPREEQIALGRAQAEQARAAVDYAQTMLDSTVIRAPVTGTVLERLVEKGEMVSTMTFGGPGGVKASVVSLADLSDLQVELDINQNDFPRISANQTCNVVADAYPDRIYKGTVEEIAPEANRQKATIQVKVKILQPDDFLRPEMNAHVSFLATEAGKAAKSAEALTVPRAALVERDGKRGVFVLDGSRVRLRELELGRDFSDRVEVLSGIGPNDWVVTAGQENLSAGQRVKARRPA